MVDRENRVPAIVYPEPFEPPGPAAQAELVLEVMELFLADGEPDYSSLEGFSTPEDWVAHRSMYAAIHWIYNQLVGEESAPPVPDQIANRVSNPTPKQKSFWDLTDPMPESTRQLCEAARGQLGTGRMVQLLQALWRHWKEVDSEVDSQKKEAP